MKKTTFISTFLFCYSISYDQTIEIKPQLRVPLQLDNQVIEIQYSWGTEVQKANTFNFGLDALLNFQSKRLSLSVGAGFFRNRFNIQRGYDHQALNPGRDSLPIGTNTKSYNYSILRLPAGMAYTFLKNKKYSIGVGGEHLFNFCFKRKYNGALPFPDANNSFNGINYFGNSMNIFIALAIVNTKITLAPFVRIYNKYQKD